MALHRCVEMIAGTARIECPILLTPPSLPSPFVFLFRLYFSRRKSLTSPHTILRSEKVRPSFYTNDATIASAVRRKQVEEKEGQGKGKGKKSLISEELSAVLQEQDLENREFQWYVLQDLEEGASFELRISYPATVKLKDKPPTGGRRCYVNLGFTKPSLFFFFLL